MMIFTPQQVIIPSSRIYQMNVVNNIIYIHYDGGDKVDVEGTMYDKLESLGVHYPSSDAANKAIRQFYKACFKNQNAFYFSGQDSFDEFVRGGNNYD